MEFLFTGTTSVTSSISWCLLFCLVFCLVFQGFAVRG